MGTPLILFGAGASYGSDAQGTPPLGSALFDSLKAFSPETWGRVSQTEAIAFKTDFEQGMKEYAELHSSDGTVDKLQRAMAAFFFDFPLTSSSLYVEIAKWMCQTRWNGAVASLNYERLLELSLRKAGLNVVVDGVADPSGEIELCLPHGCCHLFGQVRSAGNVIFDRGIRFDGPKIRIIEDPDQHAEELRTSSIPPVMCYFQPNKQTRSGVSFIKGRRERLACLARSASVVVIIGVKVRPHDRHIWDPLAQTRAPLVYCSGETGASEFECWAENCGRKDDCVIPAFWADGFGQICEVLMS